MSKARCVNATDDATLRRSEGVDFGGSDANSPVNAWLVIGQAMLGIRRRRSTGRQNDEVVVVVEDNGETTDDNRSPFRLDFDQSRNVPWWSSAAQNSPT